MFRALRSQWDELDDSLHRNIGMVDQYLQKCVEFSTVEEELKKWLVGAEIYIEQISQPCAFLSEKINQAQVSQHVLRWLACWSIHRGRVRGLASYGELYT